MYTVLFAREAHGAVEAVVPVAIDLGDGWVGYRGPGLWSARPRLEVEAEIGQQLQDIGLPGQTNPLGLGETQVNGLRGVDLPSQVAQMPFGPGWFVNADAGWAFFPSRRDTEGSTRRP